MAGVPFPQKAMQYLVFTNKIELHQLKYVENLGSDRCNDQESRLKQTQALYAHHDSYRLILIASSHAVYAIVEVANDAHHWMLLSQCCVSPPVTGVVSAAANRTLACSSDATLRLRLLDNLDTPSVSGPPELTQRQCGTWINESRQPPAIGMLRLHRNVNVLHNPRLLPAVALGSSTIPR